MKSSRGRKWWKLFMKHHPELKPHEPQFCEL